MSDAGWGLSLASPLLPFTLLLSSSMIVDSIMFSAVIFISANTVSVAIILLPADGNVAC